MSETGLQALEIAWEGINSANFKISLSIGKKSMGFRKRWVKSRKRLMTYSKRIRSCKQESSIHYRIN